MFKAQLIFVAFLAWLTAAGTSSAEFTEDAGIQFVQRYCVSCHEGTEAEAALDLSEFDASEDVARDRLLWHQMLKAFGCRDERFADSTGKLAGVLA